MNMKKIICPTDFSAAAENAVIYAANLSQQLNYELEIVNVHLVPSVNQVSSGTMVSDYIVSATDILQKRCEDLKKEFNISCSYQLETTTEALEKSIGSIPGKNDIIVVGTNGADDLYQYIFGTNSYHILRKSNCPVLVVPEGATYKPFPKIVFAWDYSKDAKKSFSQMTDILGPDPVTTFLHISNEKTQVSDEVYNALKNEICSEFGEKKNISFDRVFSDDPEFFPDKLSDYMDESHADILVITYYDRGALRNILHGSIAKRLSETMDYPLLILHVTKE